MKRLIALSVGIIFSASLIAAANAAPTGAPNTAGMPGASNKQNVPLGLKNARKAMKGKIEQDKKMQEVQKKGQAKRHQAHSKK